MNEERRCLLRADAIERLDEAEIHHPLNPDSELYLRPLGDALGLERIGVHLGRVPPGREALEYHSHRHEEEFFYILSGRGIAHIDGAEHEVGPGDFMAFATPSVAHSLRNPFAEDLVYLVGGERREVEIGEFPNRGQIVLRDGTRAWLVDSAALRPFRPESDGGDDSGESP